MAITVYGRRAIRRMERETGEQLAWAAGPYVTTVDHRHLLWTGERWSELEQPDYTGGCGVSLSSCRWLFGEVDYGFTRGLLRGPCRACGVGHGELHQWNCDKLNGLMGYVNPDYWPRPVHRPQWLDDPRRDRVSVRTRSMYQLALGLGVPIDLLSHQPGAVNHWSAWRSQEEPVRHMSAVLNERVLAEFGLDPERYRLEFE